MFIIITSCVDQLLSPLHYSIKFDFEKKFSTNKLKIKDGFIILLIIY